jgi:hypothetical protein
MANARPTNKVDLSRCIEGFDKSKNWNQVDCCTLRPEGLRNGNGFGTPVMRRFYTSMIRDDRNSKSRHDTPCDIFICHVKHLQSPQSLQIRTSLGKTRADK